VRIGRRWSLALLRGRGEKAALRAAPSSVIAGAMTPSPTKGKEERLPRPPPHDDLDTRSDAFQLDRREGSDPNERRRANR
jgi:hypothetical protein